MRTTRRRVADPVLRWKAFGHNQQYRVLVRNEDTGEARIVYEGFRQDCKLPADFRLTPDQLTVRIYSRPADDPHAAYIRRQDTSALERLGDDLETEAPDLLIGREAVGSTAYRLLIRESLSHDTLVDIISDRPRFLLPVGQIRNRGSEWVVRARVGGAWRGSRWKEVGPEALKAADDRAARMVPFDVAPRLDEPAKPQRLAPQQMIMPDELQSPSTGCALIVPVTAAPALGPEPNGSSVLSVQWGEGRGDGAVERIASMLEARSLQGWFFLDLELGEALFAKAVSLLARRLIQGGHRVGVMIGRGELAVKSVSPAERLASMTRTLEEIGCEGPMGIMLADGPERETWLDVIASAGHRGVIASRVALTRMSEWMRWRTTPFSGADGLVVFPMTNFLSTPAHRRDRVVRHGLGNRDALAAGSTNETIAALSNSDRPWPILVEIDPLLLLDRRRSRDRAEADLWNNTLRQALPAWQKAGWRRSTKGFDVAREISEIQHELLAGLLDSLAASSPPQLEWNALFDHSLSAAWLVEPASAEPVFEHRRGIRRFRLSAVRRYDSSYRTALGAPGIKSAHFRRQAADVADIAAALDVVDTALDLEGEAGVLGSAAISGWRGKRTRNSQETSDAQFPLVFCCAGTPPGGLADTLAAVRRICQRVSPGGLLLLGVPSLAYPSIEGGAHLDALLFPHLAAHGEMGADQAARTPLGLAAWSLLLRQAGLEVVRTWDEGTSPLPSPLLARHEARLSLFDPQEVHSAPLLMLLRRTGEPE